MTAAREVVVVLLMLVPLSVGGARLTASNETRTWQLRGTVTSITEHVLSIRHKSGRIVALTLDDRTVYLVNRQADSRAAVHIGTRVTVDVETLGQRYLARQVQLTRR